MASILELSHSSILHGACTLDNTEYLCFTQFINIKQAERNTQQAQSNMIRMLRKERKGQEEPNVQEKKPSGHRSEGKRVRWKQPLCETFYYRKYIQDMRGTKQQMLLQLQQSQPSNRVHKKRAYKRQYRYDSRSYIRRLV
jgi:hypothetical protein